MYDFSGFSTVHTAIHVQYYRILLLVNRFHIQYRILEFNQQSILIVSSLINVLFYVDLLLTHSFN